MLKSLVKYSLALFASNVFTGLLSFLATMAAARLLPKSDFGLYNHYVLIYTFTGGFFLAGTQQALITFININRKTNEPLFIRLMMTSLFFLSLVSVIASFIAFRFYSLATCIGIIAIVPNVFTMFAALIYRSSLKARGEVALRVSVSLINSLLTIGLLFIWTSGYAPIAADLCSLVLPATIAIFLLCKKQNLASMFISPFDERLKPFWKMTGPLWIAGILFSLNVDVRKILVDGYLGVEDFAIFSFVIAVYTLILRPVEMIQRAMLPVLTTHKNWNGDEKRLMFANILVFPMLGLAVFSFYPLLLHYGKYYSYENTLNFFLIMGLGLPMLSIEFVFASMCIAIERQDINKNVMIIAVLFNIPVYSFIIMKFGIIGAFCAYPLYSISYGMILLFKLRFVFREQVKFAVSLVLRCMVIYLMCIFWIYKYPDFPLSFLSMPLFIIGSGCLRIWNIKNLKEVYLALKR